MPILTTDFGGTDSGNSLTRLSDGKLLFAGNSLLSGGNYVFALARYNADGTLDTTFDGVKWTPTGRQKEVEFKLVA